MAIYHLHAKVIKRSKGQSATAAAAYRSGQKIECDRTGQTHDYTRKSGVVCAEIFAPDGSPAWVFNRWDLWNRVEKTEKRKDAQVAREVEVSLPRELDLKSQIQLVRDFVRENFTNSGMVADVAIHDTDTGNPHAHILLTTRDLEWSGFGQKNRSWNDRAELEKWRESWAEHTNHALSELGHDQRIDHRSYAAQGETKKATRHHGGYDSIKGKLIRQYNDAVEQFNRLVDLIRSDRVPAKPKKKPVPVFSPDLLTATQAIQADFQALKMATERPEAEMITPDVLDVENSRKRAQEALRRRDKAKPISEPKKSWWRSLGL